MLAYQVQYLIFELDLNIYISRRIVTNILSILPLNLVSILHHLNQCIDLPCYLSDYFSPILLTLDRIDVGMLPIRWIGPNIWIVRPVRVLVPENVGS